MKLRLNSLSFLLVVSVALISSCDTVFDQKRKDRVARVGNKYLYKDELKDIVSPGTSPADSAVVVKRYIEKWIRQQIFLQEALNSLSKEQQNFSRKVEDYRNSLIIFAYENYLVQNQLDTTITDTILSNYYEEHKNEFQLRNHIVKVNFLKLPLDAPDIAKVRTLIRSESTEDVEELEEYAVNHAATYFLHQDTWFIFDDILRDFPLNISNHEQFLRNYNFREITDDYYRYFLYIKDYKLEGTTSPLAFQSDNIKAIIMNHRKQKFINDFRQQLYKDAIMNSEFEIY
ncbi:MAG: hypothetical protein ACOCW8_02210 [bacterium]